MERQLNQQLQNIESEKETAQEVLHEKVARLEEPAATIVT